VDEVDHERVMGDIQGYVLKCMLLSKVMSYFRVTMGICSTGYLFSLELGYVGHCYGCAWCRWIKPSICIVWHRTSGVKLCFVYSCAFSLSSVSVHRWVTSLKITTQHSQWSRNSC